MSKEENKTNRYIIDDEYIGLIYDNIEDKYFGLDFACDLLNDLQHRLANCIEPKFKTKQTIWFIRGSSNKRIDKGIVYGFVNNKCIRLKQHGSHLTRDLSSVFATKEEAKTKLEEIQNANN